MSEKIALLLHPHVDVPCSWLLRNLTLYGKLCFRDEKMLFLYNFTITCHGGPRAAGAGGRRRAPAGEHGKRHVLRAHMPEAAIDWLNPLSFGTMSASAYIEHLA